MKYKIPVRSLGAQLRSLGSQLHRDRKVAAGQVATKPWFSSRRQRTAARLLAGFFAMMFLCTIVSRVSASLTMATVTVSAPQGGSLSQQYTLTGTVESSQTQAITLPGGIDITSVLVKPGSRVTAGDPLLEVDSESLEQAKSILRQEIAVLDTQLNGTASGGSGADSSAVDRANTTLRENQEDYDRLLEQQKLEQQRAQDDLTDAEAKQKQAETDLDEAKKKAQQQLIESAQDAVEAAEKALEDAKYARDDALAAAENAWNNASQSESAARAAYDNAQQVQTQAQAALADAQGQLADAQAGGDPAEITAAQSAVAAAENALTNAEGQVDSAYYQLQSAQDNASYAKSQMESTKSQQDQNVSNAEAALLNAKQELEAKKTQTDFSQESLVVSAQAALDAAEEQVDTFNRAKEDLDLNHESQKLSAERGIQSSQSDVASAQKSYSDAQQSDAVDQQQKAVERLQQKSERIAKEQMLEDMERFTDGVLTAPVSGTVKTVVEDLTKTPDDVPIVVLNSDEGNLSFVATVDEETASHLAVGTSGSLLPQTGNAMAVPSQVTAVDLPDSDGMVRVTASVSGQTLTAGSKATLEITGQSSQYRVVVPINALRSVNGKTVVYVVRETETVIGTEQRITAVEVRVQETTLSSAAIEGALSPEDRIVSSSNKPIAEGDRVRVEM